MSRSLRNKKSLDLSLHTFKNVNFWFDKYSESINHEFGKNLIQRIVIQTIFKAPTDSSENKSLFYIFTAFKEFDSKSTTTSRSLRNKKSLDLSLHTLPAKYFTTKGKILNKKLSNILLLSSRRRQLVRSVTEACPNKIEVKNTLKKIKTASLPEEKTCTEQDFIDGIYVYIYIPFSKFKILSTFEWKNGQENFWFKFFFLTFSHVFKLFEKLKKHQFFVQF